MNPPDAIPDELWWSLCELHLVRPAVVAACRARVASNDWPEPLAVADAVLDGAPHHPVVLS